MTTEAGKPAGAIGSGDPQEESARADDAVATAAARASAAKAVPLST
jgi:hypothetical protein